MFIENAVVCYVEFKRESDVPILIRIAKRALKAFVINIGN